MAVFNQNSRKSNMMKSSLIGLAAFLVKILVSFVSRSVFLRVLTVEYLGISGLFTNILTVLSLAELGITTAIVYRFYEPINCGDIVQVGRLMNFFRRVYQIIAAVILFFGLCLIPLLPSILHDASELPRGINLTAVYLLYLFQTVSSYFYVYKQVLLSADQKNYLVSALQTGCTIVTTILQIVSLLKWKNFMFYLMLGILFPVALNFLVSLWITKKYAAVFAVKEMLSKEEQKAILLETKASMLHKIGGTVLTGTDSLVLTKMVSLAATGLYSNYSVVILHLQAVLQQLLGNFTSSIGNARVNLSSEEYYKLYRKLNFIGLFLSSVTAFCLFELIGDFIRVWIGEAYLLDRFTVACLSLQYFFTVSRIINSSFTNAWNWFKKDQLRPLIESAINLGVSIYLAKKIGIAGVFLGTVISHATTIGWREPYILFRYEFKKPHWEYWRVYLFFLGTTSAACFLAEKAKDLFSFAFSGWLGLLAEGVICMLCITALLSLLTFRTEGFTALRVEAKRLLLRKK